MKIEYDGHSLPILTSGKNMYRVQRFTRGKWETLESEDDYFQFRLEINQLESKQECRLCKGEFTRTQMRQRFCSLRCGNTYRQQRLREAR